MCGSVEAHVANGASLEFFANVTNVSRVASFANVANVACSRSFLLVFALMSLILCRKTLQTHPNHDPMTHEHATLSHPLL